MVLDPANSKEEKQQHEAVERKSTGSCDDSRKQSILNDNENDCTIPTRYRARVARI